MRNLNLALFLCILSSGLIAQPDTIRRVQLPEIKYEIIKPLPFGGSLPDVNGFQIAAGRKSNLVKLDNRTADLTSGLYRQALAKVAGITIWENDGSGIQTSIATRGLSPNRSWEFNMRQDGADLAAESFGYPESYYTPPLEAVEQIEITRGAASLAYGPQFGGAVNYRLQKAKAGSPLRFESSQTLGSFSTFNSWQSFSGSKGNFFWTTWLHHRNSDGWRSNSRYFTRTGFVSFGYAFKPGLTLEANTTLFNMQSQQPGGVFDAELSSNAINSHRSRNWLSTPWNMASLNLHHDVNAHWIYELKLFGNLSERNSVGFVNQLQIPDTINVQTGKFNTRQLDRDYYRNAGIEFRNLLRWTLNDRDQTLSTGIRVYRGETHRLSGGKGNTGSGYELELSGDYLKDLSYQTQNLAAFAEQLLRLGAGFSLTPGVRLEYLINRRSGRINSETNFPDASKNRLIPLLGLSASWKKSECLEIYGNVSQAYRPVTFSELTPSATNEIIDPELKDSRGYNSELGFRGQISSSGAPILNYDVNAFFLQYANRIGVLNNVRTNIGDSKSKGLEAFIEIRPFSISGNTGGRPDFSFFLTGTYMKANYFNWMDKNADRSGKQVEYAPELSLRAGLQCNWKGMNFSGTWSRVSEVFTDALNQIGASANAQSGQIPAWETLDLSLGYGFLSHYMVKAGANNIFNERYATRRSGSYPGPGLLPGQARNVYASVSVRF